VALPIRFTTLPERVNVASRSLNIASCITLCLSPIGLSFTCKHRMVLVTSSLPSPLRISPLLHILTPLCNSNAFLPRSCSPLNQHDFLMLYRARLRRVNLVHTGRTLFLHLVYPLRLTIAACPRFLCILILLSLHLLFSLLLTLMVHRLKSVPTLLSHLLSVRHCINRSPCIRSPPLAIAQ
jgi:hypothetical protein